MSVDLSLQARYPRRAVVDDTDPRVKYNGGSWTLNKLGTFDTLGTHGPPHNHTVHDTRQNLASLTFVFEGTFIQVRGTKDNRFITRTANPAIDNTTRLPRWACNLDNNADIVEVIPYPNSSYAVNDNILCEGGDLAPGPHSLVVIASIPSFEFEPFLIDRIEYEWLEKEQSGVMKVDSSDVGIRYTGSWTPTEVYPISYNATNTTGFSFSFEFNGTGVSLFGFNDGTQMFRQSSKGTYSIDNSSPVEFLIPGTRPAPDTVMGANYFNELLFSVESLSAGHHTLTVTHTGDDTSGTILQGLNVDHLLVQASGAQLNNTNTVPPPSGDSATPSPSTTSSTPVGIIVGSVIGAICLIVATVFALFFYFKWRKARRDHNQETFDAALFTPANMQVSPYISQPPLRDTLSSASLPTRTTLYDHGLESVTELGQYRRSGLATSNTGPSSMASQRSWRDMKDEQRAVVSGVPQERRHYDSGIRLDTSGGMVDIPPNYTQN
ncbi:hypothetical protein VNI00_009200 [Paramarasmius palmivorus]|uniref:Uncharacterized protein n=1 Tax=Paramarasmius palmivorus TaxID=297713 RepID=A0AAW0CSN7_9AGAR